MANTTLVADVIAKETIKWLWQTGIVFEEPARLSMRFSFDSDDMVKPLSELGHEHIMYGLLMAIADQQPISRLDMPIAAVGGARIAAGGWVCRVLPTYDEINDQSNWLVDVQTDVGLH